MSFLEHSVAMSKESQLALDIFSGMFPSIPDGSLNKGLERPPLARSLLGHWASKLPIMVMAADRSGGEAATLTVADNVAAVKKVAHGFPFHCIKIPKSSGFLIKYLSLLWILRNLDKIHA